MLVILLVLLMGQVRKFRRLMVPAPGMEAIPRPLSAKKYTHDGGAA